MSDAAERPSEQHFTYTVGWDPRARLWRARCHEFPGIEVAVDSPTAALNSIQSIVAERLRELSRAGKPVPALQWFGSSQRLQPVADALQLASSASIPVAVRNVLLALIAQRCQNFLEGGGTVDELAVELHVTLSAAKDLVAQRWPGQNLVVPAVRRRQ